AVPGISGTPGSLIRWGADGLAFRTDAGQLFLIRTPLVAVLRHDPLRGYPLRFHPDTTVGGERITGSVRLAAPAPAGGTVVTLASAEPAAVRVPVSVAIPEGATSVEFPVVTRPVRS